MELTLELSESVLAPRSAAAIENETEGNQDTDRWDTWARGAPATWMVTNGSPRPGMSDRHANLRLQPPVPKGRAVKRALTRVAIPAIFVTMLSACGSATDTKSIEADVKDDGSTMFTAVRESCELPADTVRDGGATLVLDGEGEKSSGLTIQATGCALGAIGTPDSIIVQIEQTRALDGRQSATNDGYSYSWVYHPDNGLDITVTDSWTS